MKIYEGEMALIASDVAWSCMLEPLGGKYVEIKDGERPSVVSVWCSIDPEESPSASLSGSIKVGFWASALSCVSFRLFLSILHFTIL